MNAGSVLDSGAMGWSSSSGRYVQHGRDSPPGSRHDRRNTCISGILSTRASRFLTGNVHHERPPATCYLLPDIRKVYSEETLSTFLLLPALLATLAADMHVFCESSPASVSSTNREAHGIQSLESARGGATPVGRTTWSPFTTGCVGCIANTPSISSSRPSSAKQRRNLSVLSTPRLVHFAVVDRVLPFVELPVTRSLSPVR